MPLKGSVANRGRCRLATDVRVTLAVREVDDQSDDQPDDQSEPRIAGQTRHQPEAAQDAEERHERHERRLERTGNLGRPYPKDPPAAADDHECEERPDAHELS